MFSSWNQTKLKWKKFKIKKIYSKRGIWINKKSIKSTMLSSNLKRLHLKIHFLSINQRPSLKNQVLEAFKLQKLQMLLIIYKMEMIPIRFFPKKINKPQKHLDLISKWWESISKKIIRFNKIMHSQILILSKLFRMSQTMFQLRIFWINKTNK